MKKNRNEIAELLEAWLAEAILRLHEMEMALQSEKEFITDLLNLVRELRE